MRLGISQLCRSVKNMRLCQRRLLTLSLAFNLEVLLALVAISRVTTMDAGCVLMALDANGEILDKMEASMFWVN